MEIILDMIITQFLAMLGVYICLDQTLLFLTIETPYRRHNAIGFNNYPDDKPNPPYFTGWLGYLIRGGFVRYLAIATQRLGIYVWVGKRRYASAQRRQQAREQEKQMQPRRA